MIGKSRCFLNAKIQNILKSTTFCDNGAHLAVKGPCEGETGSGADEQGDQAEEGEMTGHAAQQRQGEQKSVREEFHSVKENETGSMNSVRTGLPPCLPGFHLGMSEMTRRTSSPQPPPMSRIILALVIEPSFSTTNRT